MRDVVTDFTPVDEIRSMLPDVGMDEFLVETSAHLQALPLLQDSLI